MEKNSTLRDSRKDAQNLSNFEKRSKKSKKWLLGKRFETLFCSLFLKSFCFLFFLNENKIPNALKNHQIFRCSYVFFFISDYIQTIWRSSLRLSLSDRNDLLFNSIQLNSKYLYFMYLFCMSKSTILFLLSQ